MVNEANTPPTNRLHHDDDREETEDGGQRRVKRRTGPFKRSRTGCGTCKRRGKKCDEEWTSDGHCQRCIIGQFECTGRTLVESKKKKRPDNAPSPTRNASPSPTQAWQEEEREPGTSLSGGSIAALPPNALLSGSMQSNPSNHSISPHNSFTQPTPPSNSLNNTAFTSHTSAHASSSGAPSKTAQASATANVNFAWYNVNHAPSPAPHHDPSSFLSLAQPGGSSSQPAGSAMDWAAIFGGAAAGGSGDGSFLATTECGALAFDPALAWGKSGEATPNELWDPAFFGSLMGPGAVRFSRNGVSLAEIYARVIESWLVGIPSDTREYVRARLLALNDSSNTLRNVKYAVAASYIALLSSSSAQYYPRCRLSDLCRKATGIVEPPYELLGDNTPDPMGNVDINSSRRGDRRRGEGKEAPYEAGQISQRMKDYAEGVTAVVDADVDTSKWVEDALRTLRDVVVVDEAHLSDLLWGVIDLQFMEFVRSGAKRSYAHLALGDRLVRSALGSHHPGITLKSLNTPEQLSLRLFAVADLGRCIVERGRRTIFNFWSDHPSEASSDEPPESSAWSSYLGLPDPLLILLAEIVNLAADLSSSSSASIKEQAGELETAIRTWKAPGIRLTGAGAEESGVGVGRVVVGEIWRLTCLVLLYQSVHRVGGLHPTLRHAQSEILSLLDALVPLPRGDLASSTALPAFLAATLSITKQDRERAMRHLLRAGPEKVWLDNVAVVEKIWEEVDESGQLPDWCQKMNKEGMCVAFF
ncbi:hypothetical protein I350_02567 [Cryptococcus amylolentus CBS 6273]|uniref:Zn(2)-C6 fungal-type domain-containing protein n=1 Tax=Cryptococcus amylolentus CBS 6273 TaxID=1296118 RepID=A0A1E3K7J8_9TREE|nr:hypothetical protein I350_02567 [Cryptococcus amylolentus CBS 6273]